MTITYPAALVGKTTLDDFILEPFQAVARSPYGGKSQTTDYGAIWRWSVGLPPIVDRTEAGALAAFLVQRDNFYFAPPGYTPKTSLGTVRIRGANQAGTSINVDGFTQANTTVFNPGEDWVQIGTRIHLITNTVTTNSSRQATLNLEPAVVATPADNALVDYASPQGLFQIEGPRSWNIDDILVMRTSFEMVEVL